VRGFGFFNDGANDTVFRFLNVIGFDNATFSPNGFDEVGGTGDVRRRQVEQYLLAFDSNLAPIVGQQVTFTGLNTVAANQRLALFINRANEGECDLVAKMSLPNDQEHGYLYVGADQFLTSEQSAGTIVTQVLLTLAQGMNMPLTFTCAPPGSGERIGIDRDLDGIRDGDEL
jgi:hypothetical protein